MRKFCGLLVLCLLWITPLASQTKTQKERDDLVGPVKRVEAYRFDLTTKDNQSVEKRGHPWQISTYNAEGNIAEQVLYDQNGAITARHLYTYDASGRSTGYEEYVALLDKTLATPRCHVYTLNAAGRKVEYTVFESNGTAGTRFVYKYDAKGNLIEEQWYAHTGRLGGRTVYTFDDVGNQTSQTSYEGNGSLNWKNISKYDANGNNTEFLQYHGNTLRYKMLHSYDSKGRILEKEILEFNSGPSSFPSHAPVPGKIVYTYDDEKRTKEVATYKVDGTLRHKVTHAYDERKNEVGLTIIYSDGPLQSVETRLTNIEYDSHGNWTRKTHSRQPEKGGPPQPYHEELRVITYY
jgi:hypothetical protein